MPFFKPLLKIDMLLSLTVINLNVKLASCLYPLDLFNITTKEKNLHGQIALFHLSKVSKKLFILLLKTENQLKVDIGKIKHKTLSIKTYNVKNK